jgi:predicted Fe-Mo cluster-binding NifX family protein
MKIAVTATGPSLSAVIDERFGRCSYFLIVDMEDSHVEALENPYMTLNSDAGVQAARLVAEKGVKFVLTGNCGPKAHQSLSALEIGVILGCSGVAREVVELFKEQQRPAADGPNVPKGFGTRESLASLMHKFPRSTQKTPTTDRTRESRAADPG